MRRELAIVLGMTILLAACSRFARKQAAAPPAPPPRVDTVTVTKEVPPPLPEGTAADICLSTGYSLQIHVGSAGDTLIGSRRVPLRELQPGIVFEGRYANGQSWFVKAEPIRFERRSYRKLELPLALKCEDLKQIGEHNNVPLFADLMVLSPVETIYVPIAPGRFQPYRTALPRR
jgi:hypothetical protein